MSDCINGCLTDTFNYINDVCGQLTFALYTLFTFFFASKLTGWTESTFTLYVVFVVVVFYDLLPNTDNTTSHISFHFHIHYFRRALPVPSLVSFRFSSFFTCDRDGQLSTVKLRACVCVCVCGATLSIFTVSYCPSVRAPQKNKWWHWQLSSLVYLILL